MDGVIRDAIEIAARKLADRESKKLDKMIGKNELDGITREILTLAKDKIGKTVPIQDDPAVNKPRIDSRPHPYWAKHAMRFKGNDDATLLKCRSDAEMNCPADLPYAIREVNGDLEWYAPISPQSTLKED